MSLVGNLEDLGFGDILQIVSLSGKSGVFRVHDGARNVKIIFRSGQVISAFTNFEDQDLCRGLLDRSEISEQIASAAVRRFREGEGKLGIMECLLEAGAPASAVEEAVLREIQQVVFGIFAWKEGDFSFELKDIEEDLHKVLSNPQGVVHRRGMDPQFLAMEGARLTDEARRTTPGEPRVKEESGAGDAGLEDPGGGCPREAAGEISLTGGMDESDPIAASVPADAPGTRVIEGPLEAVFAPVSVDYFDPGEIPEEGAPREEETSTTGSPEPFPPASADESPVRDEPGEGPVILEEDEQKILQLVGGARAAGEDPERRESAVPMVDLRRALLPDIEEPERGRGSARGEPQDGTEGLSILRSLLCELSNPIAGGQIALLILRFAAEVMNRAVLFMANDTEVVGLGQFGIEDPEANPGRLVRRIQIPLGEPSVFHDVVAKRSILRGPLEENAWNARLLAHLGGGRPVDAFVAPVVAGESVVVVLYGDNLPESKPIKNSEALEIFLTQAGLAFEKAILERRIREMSTGQ